MGLHHTTDLREAMDLGNQLQRFSDQLRDKAERILRETGPENRAAQDLLHRAERIRYGRSLTKNIFIKSL